MLNNKGTSTILTRRLVLRKFEIGDVPHMYKNWASDESTVKYLTWNVHRSESETRAVLKTWIEQYRNHDYYNWAMEYCGEVIGNISLCANQKQTYAWSWATVLARVGGIKGSQPREFWQLLITCLRKHRLIALLSATLLITQPRVELLKNAVFHERESSVKLGIIVMADISTSPFIPCFVPSGNAFEVATELNQYATVKIQHRDNL